MKYFFSSLNCCEQARVTWCVLAMPSGQPCKVVSRFVGRETESYLFSLVER